MDKPIEHFWQIRLTDLKKNLETNNFEVFLAENGTAAKKIVMENIIAAIQPKSISWGGSVTFIATGLYDALKNSENMAVLDTLDNTISRQQAHERRRQSLLVDLFIAGTNAVTEAGQLVNLDMVGNRIGGLTFGPKNVVVLVGRNKIVCDLKEAIFRIKNYAAPTNAMRLDKKTPCTKTGYCEECSSPDRICNTWTIIEKSFPKGRVRVVLINESFGL